MDDWATLGGYVGGPALAGFITEAQKALSALGMSLSPNPEPAEISSLLLKLQANRKVLAAVAFPGSPMVNALAALDNAIAKLQGIKSQMEARSLFNFSLNPSINPTLNVDFKPLVLPAVLIGGALLYGSLKN